MTYTLTVPTPSANLTTEEFLHQHGDNPRYELIDGVLRDLEPTGPHEEVAGAIVAIPVGIFNTEINQPANR